MYVGLGGTRQKREPWMRRAIVGNKLIFNVSAHFVFFFSILTGADGDSMCKLHLAPQPKVLGGAEYTYLCNENEINSNAWLIHANKIK